MDVVGPALGITLGIADLVGESEGDVLGNPLKLGPTLGLELGEAERVGDELG